MLDKANSPEPAIHSTPELELWSAAVERYFMDVAYPKADKGEALADFQGERIMLRRLALFAGIDFKRLEDLTLEDLEGVKFSRAG